MRLGCLLGVTKTLRITVFFFSPDFLILNVKEAWFGVVWALSLVLSISTAKWSTFPEKLLLSVLQ